MSRMPTAFIPHGGGPWPHMALPMLPADEASSLLAYLRGLGELGGAAARAVVVVSAHWEAPVPTVNPGSAPPLLFDYHGFPAEAYRYEWPAPGEPELASRVRGLLEGAGFETAEEPERGLDHGVFIPLMAAWPEPTLPVVQLSMLSSLDPAEHLALGAALAPLRDEGVLILGSGNSFHNLRALFGRGSEEVVRASLAFDAWLADAVAAPVSTRSERLRGWEGAPHARLVHPREEHLLPLMVAAGAAGNDPGRVEWSGTMAGYRISAHHFG